MRATRSDTGMSSRGRPSNRTWPDSIGYKPSRTLAKALFPEPTGPVTATRAPAGMSSQMSCNAGAAAAVYRNVTPWKETAMGPVGTAGGVGGSAALDGVDHLRHPKAAVHKAEIQLQVGDKRPHCHGAADDLLASLPD